MDKKGAANYLQQDALHMGKKVATLPQRLLQWACWGGGLPSLVQKRPQLQMIGQHYLMIRGQAASHEDDWQAQLTASVTTHENKGKA
eukprot:1161173-Pelagomonas_calceolata.AAC.7